MEANAKLFDLTDISDLSKDVQKELGATRESGKNSKYMHVFNLLPTGERVSKSQFVAAFHRYYTANPEKAKEFKVELPTTVSTITTSLTSLSIKGQICRNNGMYWRPITKDTKTESLMPPVTVEAKAVIAEEYKTIEEREEAEETKDIPKLELPQRRIKRG